MGPAAVRIGKIVHTMAVWVAAAWAVWLRAFINNNI